MQVTLSSALSVLGREALRIVLPSSCVGCGGQLPWRDRVASCCGPCWRSLPRIEGEKCRSCALPLPTTDNQQQTTVCIRCSADPLPVEWCEAWGEYRGGLEEVLHAFKFERHDFLAVPLAKLMAGVTRDHDFDALVPVPMHPARQRRRGYNQAELLARALGRELSLPWNPALVKKSAERKTQSTLARAARAGNVRGVFEASAAARGLSLLVVDDICTTGETLRACALALIERGASRVCAISAAKAT